MTISFESLGALVLWLVHFRHLEFADAVWTSVFHAVSAYCNAGFSLYDANMMQYQDNATVLLTVSVLVVVGGIGFPVLLDVIRTVQDRPPGKWARLHLHSKLMLIGTTALILAGFVSFLVLEWDGVLLGMPLSQRLLLSLFHAVTPRTAGFNAVDMTALSNATLFMTMLLMFVGAGPGSTAGGYKVSTMMILVLRGWATFRGLSRLSVFRRTVPREAVDRALVTVMLFAVVATLGLTILLVLEQSAMPHPDTKGLFMDAAFEVVSALGTVGLSVGMTTQLTTSGKVIIIILMYLGRLGPLTVFLAISMSERREPFEYPSEEPLFG
jgi:trk system potassium uptake protein TrkH